MKTLVVALSVFSLIGLALMVNSICISNMHMIDKLCSAGVVIGAGITYSCNVIEWVSK
jgi:hypothetical protein